LDPLAAIFDTRVTAFSSHGILFTDAPPGRAGYASYYGTT
jgi:hypothetical protein